MQLVACAEDAAALVGYAILAVADQMKLAQVEFGVFEAVERLQRLESVGVRDQRLMEKLRLVDSRAYAASTAQVKLLLDRCLTPPPS